MDALREAELKLVGFQNCGGCEELFAYYDNAVDLMETEHWLRIPEKGANPNGITHYCAECGQYIVACDGKVLVDGEEKE